MVYEYEVCDYARRAVQYSGFKVFLDVQDHLSQVQGQRQPEVGREQGQPQGLNSEQIC